MATHVIDPATWRGQYPEFAGLVDATVTAYVSMASVHLSPDDGLILSGSAVDLALGLMTAHIAKLMTMAAAGNSGAPVTSASEGAVSVSMVAPPAKSGWQFWMAQTPYGQMLWALLAATTAGGFVVGGLPERSAFRKVGGVW